MTPHLGYTGVSEPAIEVRGHESVFQFTQEQYGYHGNQWPKSIFSHAIHLPTKLCAHWSINSGGEGCKNLSMFSGQNVAWKHEF